jgi:hypothetical protein
MIYVGIEKNFVREIRRDKTENANVSSLVVITERTTVIYFACIKLMS